MKKVPGAIAEEGRLLTRIAKLSPKEAIARVGANLVLISGTTKGLSILSKLTRKGISKGTGQFLGKAAVGKTIKIPIKGGKIVGRGVKKADDTINLKIVGKLPRQPIKKQISGAGKRTTAVSTQADKLVGLIKSKRAIWKPIPNEAQLPTQVKALIKRFDEGKITKKQLISLDAQLLRRGRKGILERGFFADPKGRIRPSRLGLQRSKGNLLADIIRGNITFRRAKPQILVFRNTLVQKFPKKLQKVKLKLSQGKKLTRKETEALLEFQLTKSGKFKPLGFNSKESEIILSPDEIVRRVKKLGDIEVNGQLVPIIETEIIKSKGELGKLIRKINRGKKLTKVEDRKFTKLLKKQSGFKVKKGKFKRGK
ncbi:hypothetical protein LCGC14_2776280, partial [marine sediment metagenome]